MTNEDTIKMAREAGCTVNEANSWFQTLARFAALVSAAEREACAAILDANADKCVPNSTFMQLLRSNAAAIRARGNQ